MKIHFTKLNTFGFALLLFFVFIVGFNADAAKLNESCTSNYDNWAPDTVKNADARGDCEIGYCISGKCQLGVQPTVGIGDFKEGQAKAISNTTIGEFISEIYKFAVGTVGILATVVMMIGGFIWITSGGNASRVGDAKTYIGGALTGLVLVVCSWLILNTVNNNLVIMKPVNVYKIGTMPKCCDPKKGPQTANYEGSTKTFSCETGQTICDDLEVCSKTSIESYSCAFTNITIDSVSCKTDGSTNFNPCRTGYCAFFSDKCIPCKPMGGNCERGHDITCCNDLVCNGENAQCSTTP